MSELQREIWLRDNADLISPWRFTPGERQRLHYMRLMAAWRAAK